MKIEQSITSAAAGFALFTDSKAIAGPLFDIDDV